jgi:hypothetical protein
MRTTNRGYRDADNSRLRHRSPAGRLWRDATGAAIGLIGGPIGVAVGAVIGGGAGALTGASTESKDLNLGAPPWSETN